MSVRVETGDLPVTLGEVKGWLRMAANHDDATLAALIRTAADSCEAFTGLLLLSRPVSETLAIQTGWQRLSHRPVAMIDGVAALSPDGIATPLAIGAFAIDIDAAGDGWVRVDDPGDARRIQITYQAGLGSTPNAIPEALRHGIIRLVEHLFMVRDGAAARPPAIVTALWQPWRRMRLGR